MPKETLDHLRSKKRPVLKTVYIPTDDEVASEFNRLEQESSMLEMQSRVRPEDTDLAGRALAAKAAFKEYEPVMRKNAIKFVFKSIGRKKMDALITNNPATDEEKAEELKSGSGDDGEPIDLTWSPKTFPTALIARAMVEPELSEAEILEWMDDDEWGAPEIMTLFSTALQANTTHQLISLGKELGKTPASS